METYTSHQAFPDQESASGTETVETHEFSENLQRLFGTRADIHPVVLRLVTAIDQCPRQPSHLCGLFFLLEAEGFRVNYADQMLANGHCQRLLISIVRQPQSQVNQLCLTSTP
jgi:hypothetical protein